MNEHPDFEKLVKQAEDECLAGGLRLIACLILAIIVVMLFPACGGSATQDEPEVLDRPLDQQLTWGKSSLVLAQAGAVARPVGTFTLAALPLKASTIVLSVNAGSVLAHAGSCLLSWQAMNGGRVLASGAANGAPVPFALPAGEVASVVVTAAISSTVPTYCEWAGVVIRYTVG